MSQRPATFEAPGLLHSATFAQWIPGALRERPHLTGARYNGVLYERKMHEIFAHKYQHHWMQSPWITFTTKREPYRIHYCQPDGIVFFLEEGFAYVPEFKLKHTDLAWWQLHYLYIPVLEHMFPKLHFVGVEVCRWYDAATKTAAPVRLCPSLDAARRLRTERARPDFFVHIFNPATALSAAAHA